MPDVSDLKQCLTQNSTNCDSTEADIDAVKPILTCVYDVLKKFNDGTGKVVAYGDIIIALVNATTKAYSDALAKDLKNSLDRTDPGVIRLTHCTKKTFPVSLPNAVVGQCASDFETDCENSSTELSSPLLKFLLCLVNNAVPNTSQDKIVAVVCDLAKTTQASTKKASYLWTALRDIDKVLCQ